jgi:predicted aminopeptidase
MTMNKIRFETYDLLLSYNPCELFDYFGVNELHGLSKAECENHTNNRDQSYIAGMCNYHPNLKDRFVFLNLSRCNNDFELITLINHELLHQSFYLFKYDINKEEDIISWAEMETSNVFKWIKKNELQIHHHIKKD